MGLAEYLKNKIKHAFKSVIFNRTQYVCFFVAMFIVEVFCGLVISAAHNANRLEYKYITENYTHHLELRDLNMDQYYYMANDTYTVFTNQHIYDTLKEEVRIDAVTGDKLYTLYIRFLDDPKENYRTFRQRYFGELTNLSEYGHVNAVTTPLYDLGDMMAGNGVLNVFALLLVTALSVALVTALYNIRINHYRFEYGIYMTFGADFRRLMSICVWEMLVISVLVYIPAAIVSWLISLVVFASAGVSFEYFFGTPPVMLLFALIVALLAVCMPIWRLSRRTPRSNILAEDNSNLVISPRISFEMLGKTYPRGYELISMWRFRKYLLKLFAVVSLFSVLFTTMIYAAKLIDIKNSTPYLQFYVDFGTSGYEYDGGKEGGYMREELLDIPGIVDIYKLYGVAAPEVKSHVAFESKNVPFFSPFRMLEDGRRASNLISYVGADPEVIEYLSRYEYDGDPNSVLTNEKTVIITDSTNIGRYIKINPGDKIWVAKYKSKIVDPPQYLTEYKLLEEQLKYYKFDYTEYTVGAVIRSFPGYKGLSVFFSESDFAEVTGSPLRYTSVSLFVDPSLSEEEAAEAELGLYKWADYYPGTTIINSRSLSEMKIAEAKNIPVFIICIASLMLTVVPLVWFFSQVLFSLKREGEFNVLLALGGLMSEVRRQLIYDGILSAVISSILMYALMNLGSYIVFRVGNALVVMFSKILLRYVYGVPWLPVGICLVLGIVCSLLACYIPFVLFRRRADMKTVTDPVDV